MPQEPSVIPRPIQTLNLMEVLGGDIPEPTITISKERPEDEDEARGWGALQGPPAGTGGQAGPAPGGPWGIGPPRC